MLQGLAVMSDAKVVDEFIPTLPLPRHKCEQFYDAEKNAQQIVGYLMYSAFAAIYGNDFPLRSCKSLWLIYENRRLCTIDLTLRTDT